MPAENHDLLMECDIREDRMGNGQPTTTLNVVTPGRNVRGDVATRVCENLPLSNSRYALRRQWNGPMRTIDAQVSLNDRTASVL